MICFNPYNIDIVNLISYYNSYNKLQVSYMPEEVVTIVKIPLSEIEETLREKHILPTRLADAHIEGDSLVLSFKDADSEMAMDSVNLEAKPISPFTQNPQRKRRLRKKRNRMKTRGWEVVARITNSKGQKCSIYKPFVDALQNQKLTVEEQKKKVESILRANRNKPSEESIQYFLDNTLEYLKENSSRENVSNNEP
jgi:hypothetical protein